MTRIIVWCRIMLGVASLAYAACVAAESVFLHEQLTPAFVSLVFGAIGAVLVMPDPDDLT